MLQPNWLEHINHQITKRVTKTDLVTARLP